MPKILYLDHTSTVSGAEISLLDFLSKLDRQKYIPLLICPADGSLIDKAKATGIRVQPLSMPHLAFSNNPLKLLLSCLATMYAGCRLKSIIKNHKINVVHANSIRAALVGTVAGILANVPVIWHVRDFLPHNVRGKLIRWIAEIKADRIIAISQAIRDDFSTKRRQRAKTVVIYDGVNLKKYNVSHTDAVTTKTALGLSDAFPIIGVFGQIIDWKGQKEFIQAAGKITETLPNAKFLVVGDALFRKDETLAYKQGLFDLVASLGIDKRVVFTGFRDDIPDLMAACDISVLASWKEPLGLVQLEGMALEKPVVSTNAGGAKEVVQHGITGMLVPPHNPDAIARSVIELIEDENRLADLGRAGRKRVEQYFDLDTNVKKLEHLYEEVLG